MARESTIKLEFSLEDLSTPATPMKLKTPGITKSVAAGTTATPATTVIHTDATTPPANLPKTGDLITVSGSGWKSLDGRILRVTAYNATSGDLTVAADTFAETTPVPTTLTDIEVTEFAWAHACLSEFSTSPGTPGEIDATTMCDTERVNLPGLSSAGTATFTGMFDLDDAGMAAFMAAQEDAKPRWLIAKTRFGQIAAFHGVVSSFSIGSLGVEQAVTFTGSFTLDKSPTYMKAA